MKQIRLIDAPPRVDFRYPGARGDLIITTRVFGDWSYTGWWQDEDIKLLDQRGIRYKILAHDRRQKERRRG